MIDAMKVTRYIKCFSLQLSQDVCIAVLLSYSAILNLKREFYPGKTFLHWYSRFQNCLWIWNKARMAACETLKFKCRVKHLNCRANANCPSPTALRGRMGQEKRAVIVTSPSENVDKFHIKVFKVPRIFFSFLQHFFYRDIENSLNNVVSYIFK